MAKIDISTKRLAISKANTQTVAVVAVSAFVTIFCLVASKAVWSQTQYQSRVTSAKQKAHAQLVTNIKSVDSLVTFYQAFDKTSINVLGGNSSGSGDNDGSNAKIILDALPSAYDFPALTSSLEKILADSHLNVSELTGTDDQLNQEGHTSSPNPIPVTMPFSFSVINANYTSVEQLIDKLQKSVRPIQIDSITLAGAANDMTVSIKAHTYYQPAKSLTISKQVVK